MTRNHLCPRCFGQPIKVLPNGRTWLCLNSHCDLTGRVYPDHKAPVLTKLFIDLGLITRDN